MLWCVCLWIVFDGECGVEGRVIGADIVEYNPDTDIDRMTAVVAAKLMLEFSGKIVHSNTVGTPLKP